MLSEYERRLARLAVEMRYLTGNQLSRCFDCKRAAADTLDKVLVAQGFLTEGEMGELLRLTEELPSRAPYFAELLREEGLATDTQIRDALDLKHTLASQNVHRYLGEILVERRVLSPDQVAKVLAHQGKVSFECRGCGYRFNADHGAGYECPECGRPLEATGGVAAVLAPCTIREEIARSDGGAVFLAFHEKRGCEVALKVLPPARMPSPQARRARELTHPNVARVYEFGMRGQSPCVVSEFVDGIPLYDHVIGNMRLPLEEAIPILKQIAAALGDAHARQIVHGNLKAQNVLVTHTREIKVTDFGLAHAPGGQYAPDLQHYLAPERYRDGASAVGDLYACGVLWYFMLSGRLPFAAPSSREVRRRHAEFHPAPLARCVPDLPPGADAVFLKLTYKEPGLRYRSAAALQKDLDRLENGEPPQAELELQTQRRSGGHPGQPGLPDDPAPDRRSSGDRRGERP